MATNIETIQKDLDLIAKAGGGPEDQKNYLKSKNLLPRETPGQLETKTTTTAGKTEMETKARQMAMEMALPKPILENLSTIGMFAPGVASIPGAVIGSAGEQYYKTGGVSPRKLGEEALASAAGLGIGKVAGATIPRVGAFATRVASPALGVITGLGKEGIQTIAKTPEKITKLFGKEAQKVASQKIAEKAAAGLTESISKAGKRVSTLVSKAPNPLKKEQVFAINDVVNAGINKADRFAGTAMTDAEKVTLRQFVGDLSQSKNLEDAWTLRDRLDKAIYEGRKLGRIDFINTAREARRLTNDFIGQQIKGSKNKAYFKTVNNVLDEVSNAGKEPTEDVYNLVNESYQEAINVGKGLGAVSKQGNIKNQVKFEKILNRWDSLTQTEQDLIKKIDATVPKNKKFLEDVFNLQLAKKAEKVFPETFGRQVMGAGLVGAGASSIAFGNVGPGLAMMGASLFDSPLLTTRALQGGTRLAKAIESPVGSNVVGQYLARHLGTKETTKQDVVVE